jgi:hypothetical protein
VIKKGHCPELSQSREEWRWLKTKVATDELVDVLPPLGPSAGQGLPLVICLYKSRSTRSPAQNRDEKLEFIQQIEMRSKVPCLQRAGMSML